MHSINGMGVGMGWGWIIGLIFIVAIIWLIVKYVNQNDRTNQSTNKSHLDILKERYARGEIYKSEYDEIKRSF